MLNKRYRKILLLPCVKITDSFPYGITVDLYINQRLTTLVVNRMSIRGRYLSLDIINDIGDSYQVKISNSIIGRKLIIKKHPDIKPVFKIIK